MIIEHSIVDKVLFLRLQGRLISNSDSHDLLNLVSEQIELPVYLCAVDLSKVEFIDSSGIGVLVSMLTKFRNRGGEMVLIKPSEHIRKLLIITKLNAIFTIVNNDDAATRYLKDNS